MKDKFYLFLVEKAIRRFDEIQKRVDQTNSGKMNDRQWKEVGVVLSKALFFLSPIIIERLIIASPKIIFRWLFSTNKNIYSPYGSFWLSIAEFLYSPQNFENVFKPIVSDWREESYEALNHKENRKIYWINVRYTYAFLAAMWQKSPIGDLIEFVSKLAK